MGTGNGSSGQTASGVTVSPGSSTVRAGDTQQFTANLPDAVWSISPVDIGSIDAAGLYRAPDKIQGNNVQVQVIAHSGVQTATAAVTIRKN